MDRVVVLGAGFVGVNAALSLYAKGLDVVLVDEDLRHEYIPGTIDLIRGRVEKSDLVLNVEEFLPDGIESFETVVEEVQVDKGRVLTGDGALSYDKLVVGLGGEPNGFGLDFSDAEHVWGVEPAVDLVEGVEEADSALVVGAGYVGVEVAGELADKGLETTVIDGSSMPLGNLRDGSSRKILETLEEKDVNFIGEKRVSKVRQDGVSLEDGGSIESDLVVWCGGVKADETVQKSFSTDFKGACVNRDLSLEGCDNVFVAGDAANLEGVKTAHKAMKQAEKISSNISKNKTVEALEKNQKIMIISIGSKAALVYKQKIYAVTVFFRYIKDLIRIFYNLRLNAKRTLSKLRRRI
jgi:NADH dehydrogenase FAD-containing subunit